MTSDPVLASGITMRADKEYDEDLLPTVSAHEDINRVSTALGNASIKNHLPAFQRCADGRGHGKRRGLKMADENQETAN